MKLYGLKSSKSKTLGAICYCCCCLADDTRNRSYRKRNRKRARQNNKLIVVLGLLDFEEISSKK